MNEEPKYYKADIERSLRTPLLTIASAKGLEVRELVSQVLRNFVSARVKLVEELAKNNEKENKTQ